MLCRMTKMLRRWSQVAAICSVSGAGAHAEEPLPQSVSNTVAQVTQSSAASSSTTQSSATGAVQRAQSATQPSGAFECVLQPHEVVDISSAVDGVLESLGVERGDVVSAGQAIAQLDAEVEKATVETARARASMKGEIQSRQAGYDYGKRKKARMDELYAKKVVPFDAKDQAETDAELAAMRLRQARENKRLAELDLQRALAILKLHTVHSPINGVVVERFKSPGESVRDDPIVRLAQLDPLDVEVSVPAEQFGSIRAGMRADVTPEYPGDTSYPAVVRIVDKVIDARSGTFGVRLELPNPANELPGGLKCQIRFPSE